MGARNTAWNGNVWYFALLQDLIFWLKVHRNAGICVYNFKIIPGVTPPDRTSLQVVVTPSCNHLHHGCFGRARE